MNKVLHVQTDKQKIKYSIDIELFDDKLVLLYEENKSQNVLVVDFSIFQYFEFPLVNLEVTKAICDKNLTNLLLFQEREGSTILFQVNLEKAITPIQKSQIQFQGIKKIQWFNSEKCLILISNNLVIYNLTKKALTNHIQFDIQNIFDIQIDPQFKYFICFHQGLSNCLTLLNKDNFSIKVNFENSGYDFINHKKDKKLLILTKHEKEIKISLIVQFQINKSQSNLLISFKVIKIP